MLTLDHTKVAMQIVVAHNTTAFRLNLGIESSIFDGLGGAVNRWLSGWRRDLRLIWLAVVGNEDRFYAMA